MVSYHHTKAKCYRDLPSAISEGQFHGDVLYVASDHASHLYYALAGEDYFESIYIEKPLITSIVKRNKLLRFAVSANAIFSLVTIGLTLGFMKSYVIA